MQMQMQMHFEAKAVCEVAEWLKVLDMNEGERGKRDETMRMIMAGALL